MTESGEAAELASEVAFEDIAGGGARPRWHTHAAFVSLALAALATVAALLSGITANALLLDRTEEIITLSSQEVDRIAVEVLSTKHDLLRAQGVEPDPGEVQRIEAFEAEIDEISRDVAAEEATVGRTAESHELFAVAAAVLAIAIVVAGMALVVSTRWLLSAGLVIGVLGASVMTWGIVTLAT
jgi:hypothetical protein